MVINKKQVNHEARKYLLVPQKTILVIQELFFFLSLVKLDADSAKNISIFAKILPIGGSYQT